MNPPNPQEVLMLRILTSIAVKILQPSFLDNIMVGTCLIEGGPSKRGLPPDLKSQEGLENIRP